MRAAPIQLPLSLAPPPLVEQARGLQTNHGLRARVVLRRMRWAGTVERRVYRSLDAKLAKLGIPARLQMDLLGGADTAM